MKIVLSGASGLVGTALRQFLTEKGASVSCLVRQTPLFNHEIQWNPEAEDIDLSKIEGTDCFVHLSGESIDQRWTPEVKKRLYESRIHTTQSLTYLISKLERKPSAFFCASGTGIYGKAPLFPCTEDSPTGEGFLAGVCKDWEQAARSLEDRDIRVCTMRFGVILSPDGGMLKKILPIFKLGLGGPIGGGAMNFSWISLLDICRAIHHLIHSDLSGPVNLTSPAPETNYYFTRKLAKALHRPALVPVPAFMIKLLFGEMGEETALSSIFAIPEKLLESGFQFQHPVLDIYFQDIFRE